MPKNLFLSVTLSDSEGSRPLVSTKTKILRLRLRMTPRSCATFHCITLFTLFFFTSVAFSEIQWTPVAKLELFGGQFFFEGQQTSFSGNGNWLFAPGIKFSERFSLIPTATGKYRRIREVKELIGGGFLTREELENNAILKGIYKLTEQWNLKLKGSFRNQLLVESADEKLGKGLFDNNKLGFGLEAERNGSRWKSVRISIDPYALRFYRYKSLASSSDFGQEIQSGENTLDFNAIDGSFYSDFQLFEKTGLSSSLLFSYRSFTDQKLVTQTGEFKGNNRNDLYTRLGTAISHRLPHWEAGRLQSMMGLDLAFSYLDSNQNNYDASKRKFNPDYYDYLEFRIAPKIVGRFFEKLDWAMSYDFSRRNYRERPTQKTDGTYETDKIYLNVQTISYSLKYPLPYKLAVVALGSYRISNSNMKFERTYRYNYSAQHYFLGLAWEY